MQFIKEIICQLFHRGYHVVTYDTRTAKTFLFGEVTRECLLCDRTWTTIE